MKLPTISVAGGLVNWKGWPRTLSLHASLRHHCMPDSKVATLVVQLACGDTRAELLKLRLLPRAVVSGADRLRALGECSRYPRHSTRLAVVDREALWAGGSGIGLAASVPVSATRSKAPPSPAAAGFFLRTRNSPKGHDPTIGRCPRCPAVPAVGADAFGS